MKDDQTDRAGLDEDFTIDIEKLRFVHGVIKEVGIHSAFEAISSRSKLVEEMMSKVYNGELLGEEAAVIRPEMRPLYFGLKNVILKEIENIDKEIDIQKFFYD
jgi:hypothetical protein